MGMDLLSEHGDWSFNNSAWRYCLETAIEFAWSPDGAVAPIDFQGEWNGDYFTNDYQTVTTAIPALWERRFFVPSPPFLPVNRTRSTWMNLPLQSLTVS